MKQNTWADTSSTLVAILGRSIPNFVFAVLLQYIFAIKLQVLPIANGMALCTQSYQQLRWPCRRLLTLLGLSVRKWWKYCIVIMWN